MFWPQAARLIAKGKTVHLGDIQAWKQDGKLMVRRGDSLGAELDEDEIESDQWTCEEE